MKKSNEKKRKKILIILRAVFFLILGLLMARIIKNEDNTMEYTKLLENIGKNNVESIVLSNDRLSADIVLVDNNESVWKVEIPDTKDFMENIQKSIDNNELKFSVESDPIFLNLIKYLPNIIMIIMVILIFKMVTKAYGTNKNFDVGNKSNCQNITFKNIAGLNEEKEELKEIVDFLKEPEKYNKMGARIPKGILLTGNSGCGKTLLAKAVAGEANVPFFSISGSEFIERFVGVGASRVRDLFKKAKENAPCIIFIDEIDAIGEKRGVCISGGDEERIQTLNQLLVEMDGFETHENIIVMAATNRSDVLDPALLRPGRLDRYVYIGNPDIGAREAILKLYAKNKSFKKEIDFKNIAKNTVGFNGADLENLINEAILTAARNSKEAVTLEDLEEAMVKVIMGPEKKSKVISEKERKLTAYHESGHAVVSKFLPTHDTVHQISIIPRGMAGGYTMYKPNEDRSYRSKSEMEEKIVSLLAGRVAEELALKDISTGAEDDIKKATEIARSMVMRYGMSIKVGTIDFTVNSSNSLKNYSEKTAVEIDEEVRDIITRAYNYAEKVLKDNIDKLHKVAQVLIEKEKIEAEEFEAIFNE